MFYLRKQRPLLAQYGVEVEYVSLALQNLLRPELDGHLQIFADMFRWKDLPRLSDRTTLGVQRLISPPQQIPPRLPRRHQRRLGQQAALDAASESQPWKIRPQTRHQILRHRPAIQPAFLPHSFDTGK